MAHTMERKIVISGALILLLVIPFLFAALPPEPPLAPGSTPGGSGGSQGLSLLSPVDGFFSKSSTAKFTFLANDTALSSCSLMLNGTSKATFTTPLDGIEQKTLTSIKNGRYSWYVLCTKTGGGEQESNTYTLWIDTGTPTVNMDTLVPEVGGFVEYNGSHWMPGDLYVNLTNGTLIDQDQVIVENDGTFADKMYMKYTYKEGAHNLIFYQSGKYNKTMTESITLLAPIILISTDQSVYYPGSSVKINGQGFDNFDTVEVTVTLPDNSTWSLRQRTSNNGSFVMPYALNANHKAGTYSISAKSVAYAAISGSTTFTVSDPSKTTDDVDKDGVKDAVDNCKFAINPGQEDNDGDGQWNACDTTPDGVVNPSPTVKDYDEDGIEDSTDNCKMTPNADQADKDGDGYGDACDPVDDSKSNIPTCTDGTMNQGEEGIDCGGPCRSCTLEEPKSGSSMLWIIIIVVVVLVLVGTVGFLAYEGKLDFSSLMGGGVIHPEMQSMGTSAGAAGANDENLKHFIFSERSQGYDDLTIRNALIQKGWPESDVDRVFQSVYTE